MGVVQHPCGHRGCPALVPCGVRYCDKHAKLHVWTRPTTGPTKTTDRGYGHFWRKLRAYVLAKEPLCRQCKAAGRIVVATEVDHIVAKAQGGTNDLDNLQPLCRKCHIRKTQQDRGGYLNPPDVSDDDFRDAFRS